jgi:hypothetical protein
MLVAAQRALKGIAAAAGPREKIAGDTEAEERTITILS